MTTLAETYKVANENGEIVIRLNRTVFDSNRIDEILEVIKLAATRKNRQPQKLRLSWAGKLSEFKDQFTAIELQKKSLNWWGD